MRFDLVLMRNQTPNSAGVPLCAGGDQHSRRATGTPQYQLYDLPLFDPPDFASVKTATTRSCDAFFVGRKPLVGVASMVPQGSRVDPSPVGAGGLGEARVPYSLQDACADVTDRRFAGLIAESGRAATALRDHAEKVGAHALRFFGRYPKAEMSELIGTGDFNYIGLRHHSLSDITMPSKAESVLASNRAILVATTCDIAQAAHDSGAGWAVDPGEAEGIAAAFGATCRSGREGATTSDLTSRPGEGGKERKVQGVKRVFDLILAVAAALVLAIPFILLAVLVKATSPGPALYWSDRIGRHNAIFRMPKFRSMMVGTPAIASHLLADPNQYYTPIGSFLRRSSLDELPQLWSILTGEMSFVGPRPALFNQLDLIELRTRQGLDELLPGLTGWAQVRGRDELPIPDKVFLDAEYMQRRSLVFDIRILWLTFLAVCRRKDVSH